ncbi:MAG: hypothetical protein WC987_05970 [Mariniphaga sp.]
MNKKLRWTLVIVGALLLLSGSYFLGKKEGISTEKKSERENEIGIDINQEGEDFSGKTIFNEDIKEITLFKYPAGSDRTDIRLGELLGEELEDGKIKRGELLSAQVIMDDVEGTFEATADVLNERGREAIAIGGRMAPVEVRNGGLFNFCCFEVFETGDNYVRISIDGNVAAEIPFYVEIE